MRTKAKGGQKPNIVLGVLLFLSVLATIIKIFVGFDIDEAYAVTMPYRLMQHDRMFLDMWEVHQTSSFLPYFFIMAFCKLTGDVTYLVIYLRIVATVIHFLLSLWIFSVLTKHYAHYEALFIALIYYNFLPKWLMNLDFSMQQLWFMTISLIFLYYGMDKGKKVWYFLCGIALALAVLAYPGMIILYPFYIVSVFFLNKENKSRFNDISLLTAGCAITAVIFFAYVLSYMSLAEFLQSIPMVFSDGSHQFSFATKISLYIKQWIEVLLQSVILVVSSFILTVFFSILTHKKPSVLSFATIFLVVSSGIIVIANLIGLKWGPFRLQVRYLILFVLAFVFCKKLAQKEAVKKKAEGIFWLLLFPSVGMFVGILLASNVGPVTSASYLVLADIAFLLLYREMRQCEEMTEREEKMQQPKEESLKVGWKMVLYRESFLVAAILFLLSLILCKGYYVRVTEYAPSNLLEERRQLQVGAVKGIYVSLEDYERITDNYATILADSKTGNEILFMGTESIYNITPLSQGRRFVSPTTISTPAFNEQWTAYFEQYTDKRPDVIFIAKNTIDNRDKFFKYNDFGKWIAKYYDVEHMEETAYLCVLYPRKALMKSASID